MATTVTTASATSVDYTRVLQATNMELVSGTEKLDESDPNKYACVLLGQSHLMDLPLKNIVKVYLDPAVNT